MDAIYAKLSSYTDVTRDDVDWFLRVPHRVVDVEPGVDLVTMGKPARDVFVVEAGWAIRYRLIDDGRRQIVNFMLPGDCFDLQAIVHARADHAITAATPMRLRKTTSSRFLEVVRTNARMATAFWWTAVQEEAILREQIVRIGRRSARERVAHLLLELHRRMTLSGLAQDETLQLPVTRDMIGDALGLSPIHVSRTLTTLRKDGLIATSRRRVDILDRDAMAEAADFNSAYLHMDDASRIKLSKRGGAV